jgi:hypothetical protein
MRRKLFALTLASVLGLFTLAPVSRAAAQGGNPLKSVAVTGTANGANVFQGTFNVARFVHKGNRIFAEGTLTGTLTKPAGGQQQQSTAGAAQQVNQQVQMPVNVASGTCQILNLTLGPLDLNLLGLRVQLNQVNLDITAEQGSGNLLGNLLCSVAKLLDNPGRNVGRLVNLLNDILGALG